MIEPIALRAALDRGLSYLSRQQLSTGGFASLSSPNQHDFSEAVSFQTVFASALILQNLTQLEPCSKVAELKKNLVQFLLSQKSQWWSWNYWDRNSPEYTKLPYPDDLDDSFCALAALQLSDATSITGEVLAHVTKLLTSLEQREGGPYKTWLVKATAKTIWHDVDLGANLNIGYFLHLQGVELPNLTKLFDEAILRKKLTTPYYPNTWPMLFFAARFLHSHKHKKTLTTLALETPTQTNLDQALQLLSLSYLGKHEVRITELAKILLQAQKPDGSWPAACFYTGVNPDKDKKFFAGSAALTTSFALLALHTAEALQAKKLQHTQNLSEKLKQKVLKKVTQRFSTLSPELKKVAKIYLKQVKRNDRSGQITLLPWIFCQAIGGQATEIVEQQLTSLGAASVYGWIAYTIYDDFLDAEAQVETLPFANCCLRELTTLFTQAVPQNPAFATLFQTVIDQQEAANTWEVTHCRFNPKLGWKKNVVPNFGDLTPLAHRSLGHSLGCIAILMQLGHAPSSTAVQNINKFFHHFLIARQLNDDAHDWETDLARGQINAVGAKLLLTATSDRKKIFWTETIDWVCDTMKKHLRLAETALNQIPELKHPEVLQKLLAGQERALLSVQTERAKALQFIAEYQKNL